MGTAPRRPEAALLQSSNEAMKGRNLEIPSRLELLEVLLQGRPPLIGAVTHQALGGELAQQDRRQLTIGWGEARQELFPEIWGSIPSVTKVVLAIVAEWALAVPWAEGLSEGFMVVAGASPVGLATAVVVVASGVVDKNQTNLVKGGSNDPLFFLFFPLLL